MASATKWIKVNTARADGKGNEEIAVNFDQVSAVRKAPGGGALLIFGFMEPHDAHNPLEMVTIETFEDVCKKIL